MWLILKANTERAYQEMSKKKKKTRALRSSLATIHWERKNSRKADKTGKNLTHGDGVEHHERFFLRVDKARRAKKFHSKSSWVNSTRLRLIWVKIAFDCEIIRLTPISWYCEMFEICQHFALVDTTWPWWIRGIFFPWSFHWLSPTSCRPHGFFFVYHGLA